MKTPAGVMVAGAILLCCSVDLPARAMLMNMKQFNGVCGCLYCENEGTIIGSDHLHRYWPQQNFSSQRTHHSVLSNARDAIATGSVVSNVLTFPGYVYICNTYTDMWC